jgi:ankyrin repeat protein
MKFVPDESGLTVFHVAAMNNNIDMIRLLGKAKSSFIGACKLEDELNRTSKSGFTPMHFACGAGNINLVKHMQRNGGNLSKPGPEGLVNLHLASMQG